MKFLPPKTPQFSLGILALTLILCSHQLQAAPLITSALVSDQVITNPPYQQAVVEPTGTLTLPDALKLASQYQPLQSIWEGRQQIAEANLQQSHLRFNPELSISQTGLQQSNERELDIAIAQRLDLFGIRHARQQLANIALETEAIRKLAYQSQLKLAVTAAYWRVTQAEWLVRLEQEQATLSHESERAAKRRLEAGRIAEVEYFRVLIAHQQILTQLDAAQASLQQARFQLTRLWGNTQPAFTTTEGSTADHTIWPVLDETMLKTALKENPQQRLLQQQQKQAQARLILAHAQAKPQPTVSLGINRTRVPSVQNGTDNRLTLGMSIPLPVFNRNQGVIRATQTLSRISITQQQYALDKRYQQIQAGLIRLNALSSQSQQLQQQQLPLAKTIQQKTLQGFAAGKFSVTEVQQATRDYQAIQFNQLQLLSQAWQLSLQLQAISLGLAPEFDINDANYLDNSQLQLWQDTQNLPVTDAGE